MKFAAFLGMRSAADESRCTEMTNVNSGSSEIEAASIAPRDCLVERGGWDAFVYIGPGGSILRNH